MRLYYDTLEYIENFLTENNNINTVYKGNIFDVDLNKQTIFPLAVIDVTEVSLESQIAEVTVSVLCLDIVDETKENHTEQNKPFYGVNNTQDIYNTQLEVINGLQKSLRSGMLHEFDIELAEGADITPKPFRDRIHNLLVGWGVDITVTVPNTENIDGC